MTQNGALSHRMTSLDASFLYLERPEAPLHVGGIYTFARPLSYAHLVRYVSARLPLIPRYTQRVVMVPLNLGHPSWEPDPTFDIGNHVMQHRLHGAGDDAELAALCAKLFEQPLDRSKPLWEMHLIHGHRGNGCALLATAHHSMIDGVSGVQLTNILMDPSPRPAPVEAPVQAPSPPATRSFLLQAAGGLIHTARAELDIARRAAQLLLQPSVAVRETRATLAAVGTLARTVLAGAPPTPFNGPISAERALGWARLSLNEVKAVKNRLGGTVNDVVLATIAGALRHYLRAHGHKTERTELRAMVPVNMRAQQEYLKLGNRVSMMVAPLPIGITDAVERLRQVSAAMDELKNSGQANEMERIVMLTDLLPPPLQRPLARFEASFTPVNTVCTNVPGPRETRYLLGEPVQLMVPIVPLAMGIGLGFAIMSYADQLTIGINADAQQVSDLPMLAQALEQSFEELWQATGLERVAMPPRPALSGKRPPRHARGRRTAPATVTPIAQPVAK